MAFCLVQHVARKKVPFFHHHSHSDVLEILELGSGMAGVAGLALAHTLQQQHQQPFRLWLTDGHPQAVHNNSVHTHLMHLQQQHGTTSPTMPSNSPNPVQCRVLKWSLDKPAATASLSLESSEHPPPCCHVALVSPLRLQASRFAELAVCASIL